MAAGNRNIMGRISHDYAVKQEAEIYSRYFSTREDVCLGLNNGYYKGSELWPDTTGPWGRKSACPPL